MRNNTYFLYSAETKKGVLVDPAGKTNEILNRLEDEELIPVAVLLTHGHFDHIMGLPSLLSECPLPVIASEKEAALLLDPDLNMTRNYRRTQSVRPDRLVRDGEILEFPGFSLRVIETPGHTEGSVCYYSEEDGILISGDTLFEYSYGRTDFPTGDGRALARSLNEVIFRLPPETRVYPGHGAPTDVGTEKGRIFL